jgi:hypothetical protein
METKRFYSIFFAMISKFFLPVLLGTLVAASLPISSLHAQQPMTPAPQAMMPSMPMPMMPMDRTITVLASGAASAPADRVTLGLTVSSGDQTATALFVKQNDIVKHLEEALEKGGITAKDIAEQPFRLMPNMEYGQNGTRIIGYRLDTPLEITLGNPKDLARIIDLATQSGASAISVDGFGLAPGRSLHEEAVKNAVANAREEAKAIAKEMGRSVGDIVSISETGEENAEAAPAKGGGGEEEEEREHAKAAPKQTNNLSEKADLKVVFEVR